MKKFLILPALTLLTIGALFTLGQQSKSAHASTGSIVVQKTIQSSVNSTKPDTAETGTAVKGKEVSSNGVETKGTETDGPGGHQDLQGGNTNHQFDGVE